MERTILHADLDAYYASVECLYNPAIRNKPVAVCGDPERRHGIILAKNYIAKGFGVKTGQALWEAKQLCPDIVFVGAHYDKYLTISAQVRELYSDYSDHVEAFSLDENWICVTGSGRLGTGEQIAKEIQVRVLSEIGLSVSIGVSFNKVIAKLGSDLNKPYGIAVITPENFKETVWPLPVGDLLYVGRATQRKMLNYGIRTIGELAARCKKHRKQHHHPARPDNRCRYKNHTVCIGRERIGAAAGFGSALYDCAGEHPGQQPFLV